MPHAPFGFSPIGLGLGARSGGGGAPSGPVQSASIDATGTILSLVLQGVDAGAWSTYGMPGHMAQATTMPGVALSTTAAGFDRSGSAAVSNGARARGLIALKPLRKTPIVPTSTVAPNADVLDETDNGNGTRTVRLRLSKPVYAGNPCQLSLAEGWRTGASAQTSVAVTNNSALAAAPVAGGRWITPPKQRVTGPFWVEIMGGSVNPEGRSGLAAVKCTATDGVTSLDFWAAQGIGTDGVPCWRAQIDPAGLSAGPITVHKHLYPWIGAVRSSGSGQGSISASFVTTADAPLMMAYDPSGTRYPEAWVHCDPVSGTTTASAAMVQASLAAAKAVAAASKPANAAVALQAIYLANRSASASNGAAAITRMADNAIIVIPPGTTSLGTVAPTTGLTAAECWPSIIGDPDDANPKANCILECGTATLNTRATHLRFANLTMNVGGSNAVNTTYLWLDNVTVGARSGQSASTAFLNASTTSFIYATGVTIGAGTAVNLTNTGSAQRFALVRSCSTPRGINALAIVGSSFGATVSNWSAGGDADALADWVLVGNQGLAITARAISYIGPVVGGYTMIVRPFIVNNVIERIGASSEPMQSIGENASERIEHGVWEGNTLPGERLNFAYNDPANLTDTNIHVDFRFANNFADWLPTKQDNFFDDTTSGTNGGAPNYGYRPWLTESLWVQDGCGFECNALSRRISTNFEQHGYGRGTVFNASPGPGSWPTFTSDRSALGTNAGGGDYRPAAGSPLIGVCTVANLGYDRAGIARGATFAAGALEAA